MDRINIGTNLLIFNEKFRTSKVVELLLNLNNTFTTAKKKPSAP